MGSTLHAGGAGARVSDASGTAPEASGREGPARGQQFVKFSGYRLGAALRGGSAEARAAAGRCLLELLDASAERMLTRVYSTVGVRADTDFVVWQVAEELEAIRGWHALLLASPLAGAIERSQSFLSMTMRSLYGNPLHARAEGDAGRARLRAEESGSAYLFVYPMVKTRAWYALPRAERQRMMDEHIAIGHRYHEVRINTTYSYGLDDQEFVVAFEADDPGLFLALVRELRESEASAYTERDTPMLTCRRLAPVELAGELGLTPGEPR